MVYQKGSFSIHFQREGLCNREGILNLLLLIKDNKVTLLIRFLSHRLFLITPLFGKGFLFCCKRVGSRLNRFSFFFRYRRKNNRVLSLIPSFIITSVIRPKLYYEDTLIKFLLRPL